MIAKVKWFNNEKGFGFIEQTDKEDIFIHYSNIEKDGYKTLKEGQLVEFDLIETDKRIYPIGRLDYDTTGVIILTNDGELTNGLTHPSSNIDKVYIAKVKGIVNGEDIRKLSSGVIIDGKKTSRARVKLKKLDKKKETSIVELTIHEGRNHQVKKMFEAVGYEVLKLKRERFAFLDVKDLKPGEYRNLTIKEVKKLYSLIKK